MVSSLATHWICNIPRVTACLPPATSPHGVLELVSPGPHGLYHVFDQTSLFNFQALRRVT